MSTAIVIASTLSCSRTKSTAFTTVFEKHYCARWLWLWWKSLWLKHFNRNWFANFDFICVLVTSLQIIWCFCKLLMSLVTSVWAFLCFLHRYAIYRAAIRWERKAGSNNIKPFFISMIAKLIMIMFCYHGNTLFIPWNTYITLLGCNGVIYWRVKRV